MRRAVTCRQVLPRDSTGGGKQIPALLGSVAWPDLQQSSSGIIDQALIIYSCDCLQQAKGDRINNVITFVQCKRENQGKREKKNNMQQCSSAGHGGDVLSGCGGTAKNVRKAFCFHLEEEKKD